MTNETSQTSRVIHTPDNAAMKYYCSVQAMTKQQRLDAGYRRWNEGTPTLWLSPAAVYDSIPDGSFVIDIFYQPEVFEKGKTDNDTRCGMLSFGVLCDDE